MVEGMLANVEAGETFIVWDDDETPAATITINRWANLIQSGRLGSVACPWCSFGMPWCPPSPGSKGRTAWPGALQAERRAV
jgi:hypothetical protein